MSSIKFTLSNKHSYIQIVDESSNMSFRKVLNENGILFTTSSGKGIHFNKKDYKRVKQLSKSI